MLRILFSQSVVGEQCLFHPSIVCNVLPLKKFHQAHNIEIDPPHLRVDSVDVEGLSLHLHGVVAVLLDYASGEYQSLTSEIFFQISHLAFSR